MGLILPKGPSWGQCSSNLTGTPSTTPGTSLTAGASNVDGTAVSLLTAVAHDIEYISIGTGGFAASAGNGSTLMDILIDPAGGTTWDTVPLIPSLLIGEAPATNSSIPPSRHYNFPVWVKSGASIGARSRTAHTATLTGNVIAHCFGGNTNPASWWCGQHVTAVGVTAASSVGTNHTAGSTGAFSAWTNFGSTLPSACGAVQFTVQGTNTNTTQTSLFYHFEFGVGSTRIGSPLWKGTGTAESGVVHSCNPIFIALPSGTQLQVRGTSSGAAQALDVAAYVVH